MVGRVAMDGLTATAATEARESTGDMAAMEEIADLMEAQGATVGPVAVSRAAVVTKAFTARAMAETVATAAKVTVLAGTAELVETLAIIVTANRRRAPAIKAERVAMAENVSGMETEAMAKTVAGARTVPREVDSEVKAAKAAPTRAKVLGTEVMVAKAEWAAMVAVATGSRAATVVTATRVEMAGTRMRQQVTGAPAATVAKVATAA
jgi:hypothetical protein